MQEKHLKRNGNKIPDPNFQITNKFQYIKFAVVLILFLVQFGMTCSPKESTTLFSSISSLSQSHIPDLNSKKRLLLFVIDFDDFMCLSCLESLIDLYNFLPSPFKKEKSWGVLIYKKERREEDKKTALGVISKKLRGFVKANRIQFPILVDSNQIFSSLSEEGTAVILFDKDQKSIKKYLFPLKKGQKKEILSFLF